MKPNKKNEGAEQLGQKRNIKNGIFGVSPNLVGRPSEAWEVLLKKTLKHCGLNDAPLGSQLANP